MVAQHSHAVANGAAVAAILAGSSRSRTRPADDRGLPPGHAGRRRYRLALHFSGSGAVLERVGDCACRSVRDGPLAGSIAGSAASGQRSPLSCRSRVRFNSSIAAPSISNRIRVVDSHIAPLDQLADSVVPSIVPPRLPQRLIVGTHTVFEWEPRRPACGGRRALNVEAAPSSVSRCARVTIFSEFSGYDTWQTVAVSETEGSVKAILGNPTMINAYKEGRTR